MTERVWYMLWDTTTGNAVGGTQDLHEAGRFWKMTLLDKTLALTPDIDCEGDCCAYGECRYGFVGGPSASSPPELDA